MNEPQLWLRKRKKILRLERKRKDKPLQKRSDVTIGQLLSRIPK
jgi:hypothetical protein